MAAHDDSKPLLNLPPRLPLEAKVDQVIHAVNQLHSQLLEQRMLPAVSEDSGKRSCMITVRVSPKLHQALKEQAHNHRVSLNELCVLKLKASTLVSVPKRADPD